MGEDYVNKEYLDKFKNIKTGTINNNKITKEITEEDECIICFDTLLGQKEEMMVSCPVCHNIIHKLCMQKWLENGNKTCVYCRSTVWENTVKKNTTGSYKNLLST
jgi:hypothetical protein